MLDTSIWRKCIYFLGFTAAPVPDLFATDSQHQITNFLCFCFYIVQVMRVAGHQASFCNFSKQSCLAWAFFSIFCWNFNQKEMFLCGEHCLHWDYQHSIFRWVFFLFLWTFIFKLLQRFFAIYFKDYFLFSLRKATHYLYFLSQTKIQMINDCLEPFIWKF